MKIQRMKKFLIKKFVSIAVRKYLNKLSDDDIVRWGELLSTALINNRDRIEDFILEYIDNGFKFDIKDKEKEEVIVNDIQPKYIFDFKSVVNRYSKTVGDTNGTTNKDISKSS